jgi:hypothetical protein
MEKRLSPEMGSGSRLDVALAALPILIGISMFLYLSHAFIPKFSFSLTSASSPPSACGCFRLLQSGRAL